MGDTTKMIDTTEAVVSTAKPTDKHNVFEFTKGSIYTHPSIRDLTQDALRERLNRIRNRRLVAALEFKTKQHVRLDSEGSKLSEQWARLRDRISTKLAQMEETVDKIDDELLKLEKLSNQLKNLDAV